MIIDGDEASLEHFKLADMPKDYMCPRSQIDGPEGWVIRQRGPSTFSFLYKDMEEVEEVLGVDSQEILDGSTLGSLKIMDKWIRPPEYLVDTTDLPPDVANEAVFRFGEYSDQGWRVKHHGGIERPGAEVSYMVIAGRVTVHMNIAGKTDKLWEVISKHLGDRDLDSHYQDTKYLYRDGVLISEKKINFNI